MEQKTKNTLTAAAVGAGVLGVVGAAVAGVSDLDFVQEMLSPDANDLLNYADAPEHVASLIDDVPVEELKKAGIYVSDAPIDVAAEPSRLQEFLSSAKENIGNTVDSASDILGADAAGGVAIHDPLSEQIFSLTDDQYSAALEAAKNDPEKLKILTENVVDANGVAQQSSSLANLQSNSQLPEIATFLTEQGGKASEIGEFFNDELQDNIKAFTLGDGRVMLVNEELFQANASELASYIDANNLTEGLDMKSSAGVGAIAGAGAGAFMSMRDNPSHAERVRPDGAQIADWREAMLQQQAATLNANMHRG